MKVYKESNNFIYLSDKDEINEVFYTDILFNFPNWKLEDVLPLIRKWKVLGTEFNLYYESVLKFFFKFKKIKNSSDLPKVTELKKLDDQEKSSLFPSFVIAVRKLSQLISLNISREKYQLLDMFLPYIEYLCDFENIFRFLFGEKVGKLVVLLLSKMKKEEFRKKIDDYLKIRSKDDQIDFLNRENNIEIIPFVDDITKLRLKLLNSKKTIVDGVIAKSKFLNENLLYTDKGLKDKLKSRIINAFELGEIITGDIIKERLNKIWDDLELSGRPKLKTIFGYFNTNIQRTGYKFLTIKSDFETD